MNKVTLEALNGSIKKWQDIVDGTGEDNGWRNCPLCVMFLDERSCDRCPISEAVDDTGCTGTPHEQWEEYQGEKEMVFPRAVFDTTSQRLAEEELEFLKGLLPK